MSVKPYATFGRFEQADQLFDQGGLTRAVGSQEAENFPLTNVQRDAIVGPYIVLGIDFDQILDEIGFL